MAIKSVRNIRQAELSRIQPHRSSRTYPFGVRFILSLSEGRLDAAFLRCTTPYSAMLRKSPTLDSMSGFSVCPVRTHPRWRVLSFDRGKNSPAIEKRKTPVKHPGVWPSQSVRYTIGQIRGERIAVANGEINGSARSVRSLIRCGQILRRSRTVERSVVHTSWYARCLGVQEKESVRAAVDKALVRVRHIIKNRCEIPGVGINRIDRRAPESVI